jgi:hypothetical protein
MACSQRTIRQLHGVNEQEHRMRYILAASLALAAFSAESKPIAFAQSADGARIVLHDDAGPCVGSAKLAEYIPLKGTSVQGCWLALSGSVTVAFLDGERGSVSFADLKKLTEG